MAGILAFVETFWAGDRVGQANPAYPPRIGLNIVCTKSYQTLAEGLVNVLPT